MSSAHPSADSAGTQPLSLFALTHSFTTTQSRALAQSRSFSRRGRDVRSHSHILHSCFARTHTHTHKHTHTRMHTNTHTHACKSKTADVPARCAGFLEPSTLEFPHSCEGFVRPSRWPRDSGQNLCAQCVII